MTNSPKTRRAASPSGLWVPEQIRQLKALYADQSTASIAKALGRSTASVYAKANSLGLHKSAAYFVSTEAGRIQHGRQHAGMVANQFKPGDSPWNKGTHFVAGGRSAETRFKKGQMSGQAQKRWVPVGSYRINGDGILDCKVTDLGRGPRDWESVARLVWKKANGELPAGHIVVFKPGRKTTVLALITTDAVEAITRAENARRNHPVNKSLELAKLVQLKGAITKQVNRINREAEQAGKQAAP